MLHADYIYIFLQSNLIEVFIYYLFYRQQRNLGNVFVLTTLSNSITHPIVFFGFMKSGLSYMASIWMAEAFAVLAETFLHGYFGKLSYRRTGWASLASNLVSWQIAPILTYYIIFR